MSTATVQLAQFLFTCFAASCAITWVVQQRRSRRERQELEQSMARAMQSRSSMYEGLEQSVVKLVNRFETVEREFRARLEEAAKPSVPSQQTVALRSHNPELWDLEREHQKVQAQQQSELAQQRARVAELMDQLERLEPDKLAVVEELSRMQTRYDNVVANSKEAERATAGAIERLAQRVRELEPLESQLEASRRELAQAQSAHAAREQAFTAELSGLQTQLAFLQPLEAQVEQLHAELARNKREAVERTNKQTATIEARERDLARLKSDGEKSASRTAELEKRCESLEHDLSESRREFAEARDTLAVTRSSQAEMQREFDRCRSDLAQADARRKRQDVALTEALASAETLRGEVTTAQRKLNESSAQRTQLERDFERRNNEIEAARSVAQTSQAKAESLELALEQARAELVQAKAAARDEIAKLNGVLGTTKSEMERQRARISAQSHHVEAAWSVLSELKPMLESLEQNLKVDDSVSAAPPSGLDLSILDEPSPTKPS